VLVNSVTRQILAARAQVASARTLGTLWEAFLYNALGREGTGSFDRLLNAPTNEAWIDPWVAQLSQLGVRFRLGRTVTRLELERGRITAARAHNGRHRETVRADWFICAMPVERARQLWSGHILAADPALARTLALTTRWMNGIQFYLREPTPILHGHVLYLDSPWALSSVSQAQFWTSRDFARDYGDGQVRDCLSVDIGDFDQPGVVYGKPARALTPPQIAREVWEQMKQHLNDTGRTVLSDDLLVRFFLDPGLLRDRQGVITDSEDPLLINTPSSWHSRPGAATAIANLLLASDYVQVDVDVACMEGANEAARQAVNALLDKSGSTAERCSIQTLYKPPEWDALKRADEQLYQRGQRNVFDLPPPSSAASGLLALPGSPAG
jgi:uncharacterized protein with NAD-binding domain and iron-sulfur cluster